MRNHRTRTEVKRCRRWHWTDGEVHIITPRRAGGVRNDISFAEENDAQARIIQCARTETVICRAEIDAGSLIRCFRNTTCLLCSKITNSCRCRHNRIRQTEINDGENIWFTFIRTEVNRLYTGTRYWCLGWCVRLESYDFFSSNTLVSHEDHLIDSLLFLYNTYIDFMFFVQFITLMLSPLLLVTYYITSIMLVSKKKFFFFYLHDF